MHHIPDNVFLIAARELASTVTDADLESGSLYPPLSHIREVSLKIAIGVTKYAYCKGERERTNAFFWDSLVFFVVVFIFRLLSEWMIIGICCTVLPFVSLQSHNF